VKIILGDTHLESDRSFGIRHGLGTTFGIQLLP
jgi:hypothetical protein